MTQLGLMVAKGGHVSPSKARLIKSEICEEKEGKSK